MTSDTSGDRRPAQDPLDRVLGEQPPPFALLRRRTPGLPGDTVEVLVGEVVRRDRLDQLPDRPGHALGALALVPFRQVTERGFTATDDGTPLAVLVPEQTATYPVAEILRRLPDRPVEVRDGGFDSDDATYGDTVRRVLDEEIATGAGANFVISRTFRARLPHYSPADGLTLFRRLLTGERGAYWTFVVHTGERTLVGASPEAHVRMSGGTVVMNPISGTYRYPPEGPTVEGVLDFLQDSKERDELSMVVDEELKMMCAVGDLGGTVVGPRLREMSRLAHTEYELRGRSSLDPRTVLRETLFAPTVTGSPVENACRVIHRHERDGRGYYGAALALLGRDEGGAQTLDSPILIRTADIDAASGELRLRVGATLVRGSTPEGEVAETHAKAAAVLHALGVRPAPAGRVAGAEPGATGTPDGVRLGDDPRVRAALDGRRAGLAPFWLRLRDDQPGAAPGDTGERAGGRHVLVVDGEDAFTAMLAHVLRFSGHQVTVHRYDTPGLRDAALDHPGPVLLGPGPGDPSDVSDPKMVALRALTADLIRQRRFGLLGVCLGHELLATEIGLDIVRRDRPRQGAQEEIDLFGERRTVGFYNSYAARCDDATAAELAAHAVEVSRDPATGEVHALRGPGFASVQFHPESVLTLDGVGVLDALLGSVVGAAVAADTTE